MAAGHYNQAPKRFSRRWWIARGQTPLWVVVVTLLIWVYADLEFTKTKEVTVTIDLQTGPNLALLGEKLGEHEILRTFKVQGNSNSIERFEQSLKAHRYHVSVDISDLKIGITTMSLEDLLSRNEEFRRSGLSVVTSSSTELRFELDRMETRTVDVQFEGSGATLLAQPNIDPPKVDVRCARSLWLKIEKNPHPPVILTEPVNLRDYAPGQMQSRRVSLRPQIGDVDVELVDRAAVTVEFQIARVTSTKQIQLNVRTLTPRSWGEDNTWREYRLHVSDPIEWQPMVNVIGSPEALEQLFSRRKEIDAYIKLTDDDKTPVDSWNTHNIVVQFPGDLDVELDPSERPTVKSKLVKQR